MADHKLLRKYIEEYGLMAVTNSDAHYLGAFARNTTMLPDMPESAEGFFAMLRGRKHLLDIDPIWSPEGMDISFKMLILTGLFDRAYRLWHNNHSSSVSRNIGGVSLRALEKMLNMPSTWPVQKVIQPVIDWCMQDIAGIDYLQAAYSGKQPVGQAAF